MDIEPDFDKIIEASNELKKHEGFLPLLIRAIIIRKHTQTLRESGNDEIIREEIRAKPRTYDEAVKELSEWCKQNNEYEDLIIKTG